MEINYFYLRKNSHLIREMRMMGGIVTPSKTVIKGTDVRPWKVVADSVTMARIITLVNNDRV